LPGRVKRPRRMGSPKNRWRAKHAARGPEQEDLNAEAAEIRERPPRGLVLKKTTLPPSFSAILASLAFGLLEALVRRRNSIRASGSIAPRGSACFHPRGQDWS
jgi:hypothetical protein